MQEEVNQQTISVAIKGGKISASILKTGLKFVLDEMKQAKVRKTTKQVRGKQTMKTLTAGKDKLANIQISDENIGSFDRIARKYAVDYALKKDKSADPPIYYVFFKAKDVSVLEQAFKEFTADVAKKQTRPSIKVKLTKALEQVKAGLEQPNDRHKARGQSR